MTGLGHGKRKALGDLTRRSFSTIPVWLPPKLTAESEILNERRKKGEISPNSVDGRQMALDDVDSRRRGRELPSFKYALRARIL